MIAHVPIFRSINVRFSSLLSRGSHNMLSRTAPTTSVAGLWNSSITNHKESFITGLRDSFLAWPHSIVVLYASPPLRRLLAECFQLNGLIFLGSVLFFEWGVAGLVQWAVSGDEADVADTMLCVLRLIYEVAGGWLVV